MTTNHATAVIIDRPGLNYAIITVTAESTVEMVEHDTGVNLWYALLVDDQHYDLVMWKHTIGRPELLASCGRAGEEVQSAIEALRAPATMDDAIYGRAPEHDKYTDAYAWRDRTTGQVSYHFIGNDPNITPFDAPPPHATMDAVVELAYARRHVPLEDEARYTHGVAYARERAAAGGPNADVNWSSGPVLSTTEAYQAINDIAGWFQSFYNDVMSTTPEYAELCGDWNALTYLLSEAQCYREKARAALAAADEEALLDAELLARARDSVAVNLEMHKIEAALFDLPC